jgi:Fe-S cluster assembly protein SufD
MHTQPQLEIYADDVKCSHGATTGQIDESALFYMQQRGIAPEEARRLLLTAFFHDVLTTLGEQEVEERIQRRIAEKLQ